jgi:hypothetical protein
MHPPSWWPTTAVVAPTLPPVSPHFCIGAAQREGHSWAGHDLPPTDRATPYAQAALFERCQASSILFSWLAVLHRPSRGAHSSRIGDVGEAAAATWRGCLAALLPDRLVLWESTRTAEASEGDQPVDISGARPSTFRPCDTIVFGEDSAAQSLGGPDTASARDFEVYSQRALWTFRAGSGEDAAAWVLHLHARTTACARRHLGLPPVPPALSLLGDNHLLAVPDCALAEPLPVSTAALDGPYSEAMLLSSHSVRTRLRAFARRLLPEHVPLLRAWEHLQAVLLLETAPASGAPCSLCSRPADLCGRSRSTVSRFFAMNAPDRVALPAALAARILPHPSVKLAACVPALVWQELSLHLEHLVRDRLLLPYARAMLNQASHAHGRREAQVEAGQEGPTPAVQGEGTARQGSVAAPQQERVRRGSFVSRAVRAASFAVLGAVSPTKARLEEARERAKTSSGQGGTARRLTLGEAESAWGDGTALPSAAFTPLAVDVAAIPSSSLLCPFDPCLGLGTGGRGEESALIRAVAPAMEAVPSAIVRHAWRAAVGHRALASTGLSGRAPPVADVLLAHLLMQVGLTSSHPASQALAARLGSEVLASIASHPLALPDLTRGASLPLSAGSMLPPEAGAGLGERFTVLRALLNAGGEQGITQTRGFMLPAFVHAVEDAVVEAALLAWEWGAPRADLGRAHGPQCGVGVGKVASCVRLAGIGLVASCCVPRSTARAPEAWSRSLRSDELRLTPGHPLLMWLAGTGGRPSAEALRVVDDSSTAWFETNLSIDGLFCLPSAAWANLPPTVRQVPSDARGRGGRPQREREHVQHPAPAASTFSSLLAAADAGSHTARLPEDWSRGVRYAVPEVGRARVWAAWSAAPLDGGAEGGAVPALASAWTASTGTLAITCVDSPAPGMAKTATVSVDYPACSALLARRLRLRGLQRPAGNSGAHGTLCPGTWSAALLIRYADGAMELWPASDASGTAEDDGLDALGPGTTTAASALALLKGSTTASAPPPLGLLHLRDAVDVGWTREPRLPAHAIDIITPGSGVLHCIPWRRDAAPALYTALRDAAYGRGLTSANSSGSVHALVLPPALTGGRKVRLQLRATVGPNLNQESATRSEDPAADGPERTILLSGKVQKRGLIRTSYLPRMLRLVAMMPGTKSDEEDGAAPLAPAPGAADPSAIAALCRLLWLPTIADATLVAGFPLLQPVVVQDVPTFALRLGPAGAALISSGTQSALEVILEYGREPTNSWGRVKPREAGTEPVFDIRGQVPVWIAGNEALVTSVTWEAVARKQTDVKAAPADWGAAPMSPFSSALSRMLGASPGRSELPANENPARSASTYDLRVATPDRVWYFRVEGAEQAGAWCAILTAFSAPRSIVISKWLPTTSGKMRVFNTATGGPETMFRAIIKQR